MNISAVSLKKENNFKGNNIGEIAKSVKNIAAKDFDSLEADDFNGVAQQINTAPDTKFTKPVKYFLGTAALAAASFLAARKASMSSIKGMEGKFPLYGTIDKVGHFVNTQFSKIKNTVAPTKVKGVKTFLQNTANSIVDWADNFAKKGISAAEKAVHKGPLSELYAKNAVRKATATAIGTGAAGLTIATRNKDANGNGIPDRAEKKANSALGVVQEVVEALPTVAAAVNLA